MRIGLITPIVLLLPRAHNEWEVDASVEDLVAVAQAADRLGYHHLTASEHIAVPVDVEARRGKRYWDLLSTFGYLGALTEQIRLATNMIVLGYHHPLEIVKHYGTLDRLTGGRLILGVGVGSLREEFELLGKEFEGRGGRTMRYVPSARCGVSASRATPARTGRSTAWWWIRPGCRTGRRSGWAGGRSARCGGPSSSATRGCRSCSGMRRSQQCWRGLVTPKRGRRARRRSTWRCGRSRCST